jgi:hypothetical protein
MISRSSLVTGDWRYSMVPLQLADVIRCGHVLVAFPVVCQAALRSEQEARQRAEQRVEDARGFLQEADNKIAGLVSHLEGDDNHNIGCRTRCRRSGVLMYRACGVSDRGAAPPGGGAGSVQRARSAAKGEARS